MRYVLSSFMAPLELTPGQELALRGDLADRFWVLHEGGRARCMRPAFLACLRLGCALPTTAKPRSAACNFLVLPLRHHLPAC